MNYEEIPNTVMLKKVKDLLSFGHIESPLCVDIGSSNNFFMLQIPNAHGLLIDYDLFKANQLKGKCGDNFIIKNVKVTPDNIVSLIKECEFKKQIDYANIDIDGFDLQVLRNVIKEFSPLIITSEINEKIPPPIKFEVLYTDNYVWNGTHYFGYSVQCLDEIEGYHIDVIYNNVILSNFSLGFDTNANEITISDKYKAGYALANDRQKIFSYNSDMDLLLNEAMPVEDKMKFIRQKFEKHTNFKLEQK